MSDNKALMMPLNRYAIEKYVEEASFLWFLREVAVNHPYYLTQDIVALEKRLDSKLQCLFTSPDEVWRVCENSIKLNQANELFTSAIVAFSSLEVNKIQEVVKAGLSSPITTKGLVSAMAWLPHNVSELWIQKFLRSKDFEHKCLALSVLRVQRRDPGNLLEVILQRNDCLEHEKLYSRALRLIGEIKRKDLTPYVSLATNGEFGESEGIWFWSRWASILLGDRTDIDDLANYIIQGGQFRDKAVQIYCRVASVAQVRKIIASLVKHSSTTRLAIQASAVLGDPQCIPWLISMMSEPGHSRVAGEAFSQITGIELEEHKLSLEIPEIISLNEAEGELEEWDEDEHLPWPNVEKIKAIWQKYGNKYKKETRYFAGKVIDEFNIVEQLKNGYQRRKNWAALELALLNENAQLVNTKARLIR